MFQQNERDARPPASEERVAAVLSAAAAPTEHGPVPGEEAAMAAFRAARQTESSRRFRMFRHVSPLKAAGAAALGTGVLLVGGIAPVASGMLPGAAQETAREMLSRFGVTVPGPDEHSSGHADQRGKSADAKDAAGTGGDASETATDKQGKGDAVSDLARNTDATGADKGAEISEHASEGRSHAGENGDGGSDDRPEPGGKSEGHAQVDTPNRGGADRPEQASGGDGGSADRPEPGGKSDGHAQVDTPNRGGADRPEQASGGGDDAQE